MIGEAIDSLISVISPSRALARTVARKQYLQLRGYDTAADSSRTRGWVPKNQSENAIPLGEIQTLRYRSWDLYRKNSYARKLVRSLEARVVGTGLWPEPQIKDKEGNLHEDANKQAKKAFSDFAAHSDWLGAPGQGGQNWIGQTRTMLRLAALSGDVLAQTEFLTETEMEERQTKVPYVVHVIHGERLADSLYQGGSQGLLEGHYIWRGIEFDKSGRRVAYHVYPVHPGESLDYQGFYSIKSYVPVRVEAESILHCFVIEDADQMRGVPWFAPLLLDMRDVGDYKQDELRAAALAACVVLGYRRPSGAAKFGGSLPSWMAANDNDGNPQMAVPSGAMIDLGADGELEAFNPMRPSANAEPFAQFILRSAACGFPGTKASTVTGDYRNSSFSSERSAENDAWPEIELVQDWLCSTWCDPIYRRVQEAAAIAGYYLGLMDEIDPETFKHATWSGPVARSINPKDDQEGSKLAIQNGTSSPQKESTMYGHRWEENVEELGVWCKKTLQTLTAAGVSEETAQGYIAALLGVKAAKPAEDGGGTENAAADAA